MIVEAIFLTSWALTAEEGYGSNIIFFTLSATFQAVNGDVLKDDTRSTSIWQSFVSSI